MVTRIIAALAIVGALAASSIELAPARPQMEAVNYPLTSYQQDVEVQINSFIAAARSAGFDAVIANERTAIDAGAISSAFTAVLQAGVDYRFEARCDRNCADLDLALHDATGRELVAGRDLNDAPGFTFRPSASGVYRVTIELYRCNAARCQVGAVVMGRA
jgi:hypothetical protein